LSKNRKILFVMMLLTFIISINLVSATELDNDETIDISTEQSTVKDIEQVQNDIIYTDTKEITKKTDKTVKEAVLTQVDVNSYNELVSQINSIQQGTQKDYTINLKTGNYNATSNMVINPNNGINYNITIDGNNLILDGQEKYCFLTLNNCSLKLKNITLKNYKTGSNGIINIKNSDLTFVDSLFINNQVYGGGTVVYSNNSSLTVINSNMTDNTAKYDGGTIYSYTSNLTILDSFFANNQARNGAAIYSYSSNTNIFNSTFINNNADKGGVINLNRGNITFNQSFLSDNSGYLGGVIYSFRVNAKIINSTLTNNIASQSGCIESKEDNYIIVNSTLSDNKATDGGITYASYSNFVFNNSNITNNKVTYDGAFIHSHGGSFNITNSIITNNTASECGAIYSFNGIYNIINSTLSLNYGDYGGAICASNGNYNIVNSILTNNKAKYGGAIRAYMGTYTITNSNLTYNNAIAGGAIYNYSSILNIKHSTFKNNKANEDDDIYNEMGKTSIYLKNITEKDYRDNITISGNITVNANQTVNDFLNITLLVNNDIIKIKTKHNGKFSTTIRLNSTGIYTIKAIFNGKGRFLPTNTTTTFNVNKRKTTINLNFTGAFINRPTVLKGNLTDKTNTKLRNANIFVTVNNQQYHVLTDKNGLYSINYTPTKIGTYNLSIFYKGNKNYKSSNISTTFVVETDLIIKSSYYRDNITILALLTENNKELKNIYVNLTINNETIPVKTDENGIIEYKCISSIAGTNTLKISYNNKIITKTFTTLKRNTTIISNTKSTGIRDVGGYISGKLVDQSNTKLKNANIFVYINGIQIHLLTDSKAEFSVIYKPLTTGTYNMTIVYKGNKNYNPTSIEETITLI